MSKENTIEHQTGANQLGQLDQLDPLNSLHETQATPQIRVEDFHAAYNGQTVLRDVNFDIQRGEVVVIGGGSGCGKSTLLKHMIGLYQPAGGRILIEGVEVGQADTTVYRDLVRRFGVAYQSGALFGSMTALNNVMLPLEEFTDLPKQAICDIAQAKLALVGLAHAANRLPAELSGGMQKRVALARAMALDPAIVFLDEPSAGLDPITSAELDQLILRFARQTKTTFVVVTHELESIFTIADRVVVLDANQKTVATIDTPQALRETCEIPWVRRFFNRQPEHN